MLFPTFRESSFTNTAIIRQETNRVRKFQHPTPCIDSPLSSIMAGAAAKARLQALSQQLVEGIPVEEKFEDLPGIRHVAEMPAGERVKGKVIIITGKKEHLRHVRERC